MDTHEPIHSESAEHEFTEHPEFSHIVGVFTDSAQATQAIEALKQAGFAEDHIKITEYDPQPPDGEESELLEGFDRRFLVHVTMPGKEEEAVDILAHHGANNSHLPRGTALVHGELIHTGVDGEQTAGVASVADIIGAEQETAVLHKTEAQHML